MTFSVALTFSGTAFHYLPRVQLITIDAISGINLPEPIKAQIPGWLQDAIIQYLQARDLLQLPVQLVRDLQLSTDALGNADIPATAISFGRTCVPTTGMRS